MGKVLQSSHKKNLLTLLLHTHFDHNKVKIVLAYYFESIQYLLLIAKLKRTQMLTNRPQICRICSVFNSFDEIYNAILIFIPQNIIYGRVVSASAKWRKAAQFIEFCQIYYSIVDHCFAFFYSWFSWYLNINIHFNSSWKQCENFFFT